MAVPARDAADRLAGRRCRPSRSSRWPARCWPSGGTPERLVRVFRALAGWLPGGTAVAAVLVCAFFTTFTGASGVTILALGSLLLPVLMKDVYSERFSLGTVTASGSIGLLFPPSLPIILYGVSARTPVNEMFYACILPGFVLVGLVSAYCIREGVRRRRDVEARGSARDRPSVWAAKWEIALPVVVFVSLFGGFATTVEAAALTVLYALFIKCVVYRDVSIRRELPKVLTESTILVGGVLIILGAAIGFTSYLIDAQIPAKGAAWVTAGIHSRWAFLLILNGFLLIVGCLMDIFSAIFVVVPLILPVAAAFDIDPLHLGAIFLHQPRARLPDAARRDEPVPVVVPVQPADAPGHARRAAVHARAAHRGVARHLRPVAERGIRAVVGAPVADSRIAKKSASGASIGTIISYHITMY